MGPDALVQLSKDVDNLMQMFVVTVFLNDYHRVAAYTMQSAETHAVGAETKEK